MDNLLDYLESGKVDFLFKCSVSYQNALIKEIRNSDKREKIMKKILPLVIDKLPKFCFEIIFDMEEFSKESEYIIKKYYSPKRITKDKLKSIITNSNYGNGYLTMYFDKIIIIFEDDLDFIMEILFKDIKRNYELLKKLSLHSNLHTRYLFMYFLLNNHSDKIFLFYDDIIKYLTSVTFEENEQFSLFSDLMDVNDVSILASLALKIDYNLYLRFKDYIMVNYKYNNLSKHLITTDEGIKEFNQDADNYFKTALAGRSQIYQKYSSRISKELLDDYQRYLKYFQREGEIDHRYEIIDSYDLSRKLDLFVDKYLSLSKKSDYCTLSKGSTASCYRIGDYVFKLDRAKWSCEDIICPDLYLILPNLEEEFIRDKDGTVLAGIEIQKYLPKDALNVPKDILIAFRDELNRLGYFTTDSLMNGYCGDNCRLLNSYSESGNMNPPEWFKEYPMVLVDRDRIYKKDNNWPKQLVKLPH